MSVLSLLLMLCAGLAVPAVLLLARSIESQSWRRSLVAFRLRLPANTSIDDVSNWLSTINAATHAPRLSLLPPPPIALEIVATRRGIEHVLLLPDNMRDAVLSGIRASLPGTRTDELPNYLASRPTFIVAGEATLSNHHRPLGTERAEVAAHSLLASLHPLQGNERVVVQWLITGAGIPKPVPSVSSGHRDGGWFLDGRVSVDPEAVRAERQKQKSPLLQASLRVGIVAPDRARGHSLFGKVWAALRLLNAPGAGIVRRWLPDKWVAERLRSLASPLMLWPLTLNVDELAGLIGFPVNDVQLPGVNVGAARQLPVPLNVPTRGAVLGLSNYPGSANRQIALRPDDRLRHTWIVGPTGAGKSTLMHNLIVQDMQAGSGMVVVDARGDLVNDVLGRVPAHRVSDLIVLDPSRTDRPVGFNVLSIAKGERGRELSVDHVLHIFHDLYRSSWGPRTADILRASLLTLMMTTAPDGSAFTLVELPELLTNDRFRRFVIQQAPVQGRAELRSFWHWYEALSLAERGQVTGPVLNKLRAFVLKTPLRLLLGQSAGLDLQQVFTQRKILLVPLSKGTLGAETAQLLGSLLVASIWQLALGRVAIAPARRKPVWLYADEFQDVVRLPIDLTDVLAQGRGLGLGLTLAHQHLDQLTESIKAAVRSTARTQIAFQLDYDDATTLSRSFAPLTRQDLMGLERFEVAARLCDDGRTLSPVTLTTLPMSPVISDATALVRLSQQQHGVDRADVEAALQARITVTSPGNQTGRQRLP